MTRFLACLFFFAVLIRLASANDSLYVVRSIAISGNGVTHESIIMRELPFRVGDSLRVADTSGLAQKARQNLINTSLFHFASLSFCDSGRVNIQVVERWYIWPVPFFNIEERNFNVWLRSMSFEKVTFGVYVYHENFRGRKEYLKLLCKTGYNQLYGFSYQKPNLDKNQNWGLSVAGGFEASHSVSTSVMDHEPSSLNLPDEYTYSGIFTSLSVMRRVGIYQLHKGSVMFESTGFADSLLALAPAFAPSQHWRRVSLNYQYRFDFRNFKNYPLKGWYADVELNLGGFIPINSIREKQFYIKSTSRKYFNIVGRLYFATGATLYASLIEGNCFASSGFMGYGNDFVRGFEYRVIPVRDFFIHRSNVKYNLLPTKIIRIPFIRSSKFNKAPLSLYTNIFYDQGWSTKGHFSVGNTLAGKFLAGYGMGLDLVTYYDKVFRLEFTMNRFREKGIFLHFTAPI